MAKLKYKEYTDEEFIDANHFQEFLRSGKRLKYDYVIVSGILYTIEEYDYDGKYVIWAIWANRKHQLQMTVDTPNNRYHHGYKDARVEIYPATSLRQDISYAE
jgi:hypothetical protein